MSMCLCVQAQRGATLVVALVMLLLFTLLVSGALTMSTVNLKAVGNMQVREEALAAANMAIDQVLSSSFSDAPAAEEVVVDINNDGTDDYTAAIAVPACIRATIAGDAPKCEIGLVCPSSTYNTVWELRATVTDPNSGAQTVVRSGVRVLLSEAKRNAVCPP